MGSFRRIRASGLRHAAVRVEPLEARRLLSAGDLDPTFAGDGTVTTDFIGATRDRGRGVVVQPDGKYVVAGSVEDWQGDESAFALTRYNPDGTTDAGFGDGGRVVFDFGGRYAVPHDVALAPGGKIVVAGISSPAKGFFPREQDFALARLNTDGTLDSSFDGDGRLLIDFGGTDVARAVVVQPDGKVVAAGHTSHVAPAARGFALARVNGDGTLDTTFGPGGTGKFAHVPDAGGIQHGRITDVAIDSDGRLVASAGVARLVNGASSTDFAAARYTPGGVPDDTFGDGGVAVAAVRDEFAEPAAVALGPGGSVVLAGSGAVVRFDSRGRLDPTFDGDGTYLLPAGAPFRFAQLGQEAHSILAVDAGGRVVVGGYDVEFGPNYHTWVALFRLDASGRPDPSFGGDGFVAGGDGEALAVTLDAQGRVVVTGGTPGAGSWPDFLVERFTADGAPDAFFGAGGRAVTPFRSSTTNRGAAVAVGPDGKVYVGGTTYPGEGPREWAAPTVVRYLPDGSADAAFGDAGRALPVPALPSFVLHDVALQPDGRVVVAGEALARAADGRERWTFAVLRYTADGSPDVSFGDAGKVTLAFADDSYGERATAVAVQPDGRVVVAGDAGGGTALARLTPSGAPDPAFGTGGKVYNPPIQYGGGFVGWSRITDVALGPGGSIVAAGPSGNDIPGPPRVWRYDASGRVDPAFAGGKAITAVNVYGFEHDVSVVAAADGGVVVGTTTFRRDRPGSTPAADFALARLNADGSQDDRFGSFDPGPGGDDPDGGLVTTDFDGGDDLLHALLALPDGSLVAAGLAVPGGGRYNPYADDPGPARFALARYSAWGEPDVGFGDGGRVMTRFPAPARDEAGAFAVAPAPGDKLVAAGTAAVVGHGEDFAVARYDLGPGGPPTDRYVRGLYVFYNDSAYDGGSVWPDEADDNAIATDKRPLRSGGGAGLPGAPAVLSEATAENVTSFSKGITGIMVDVEGGGADPHPFWSTRVRGAGSDDWVEAPEFRSSLRRGAGEGGSDRLTLVWPEGAIRNAWVEVGLDVVVLGRRVHREAFYFGNLVGETGDGYTEFRVSALDLGAVKRALNRPAPIDSPLDFNRDGRVSALDVAALKQNLGRTLPTGGFVPVVAAPLSPAAAPLEVRRVWWEEDR